MPGQEGVENRVVAKFLSKPFREGELPRYLNLAKVWNLFSSRIFRQLLGGNIFYLKFLVCIRDPRLHRYKLLLQFANSSYCWRECHSYFLLNSNASNKCIVEINYPSDDSTSTACLHKELYHYISTIQVMIAQAQQVFIRSCTTIYQLSKWWYTSTAGLHKELYHYIPTIQVMIAQA